jgi:hypothetical protein
VTPSPRGGTRSGSSLGKVTRRGAESGTRATGMDDECEQRPTRDAGGATAARSTSGRLHWRRAHARSGRHASAPAGRVPTTATAGEAGANRRPGSNVS